MENVHYVYPVAWFRDFAVIAMLIMFIPAVAFPAIPFVLRRICQVAC